MKYYGDHMKKKSIYLTLAVIMVATFGSIMIFPNLKTLEVNSVGHASATSSVAKPVPIISAIAKIETFTETLEALGTAKANESVVINPTVEDRVVDVFFQDGDRVDRGQVLVKLDDSEAQYLLAEARAALEEQKKQFARMSRLAKTNATSLAQLDEEKSLLDITRARVDSLKARLDDYSIRAPFSGILGTRQISPGAVVDTESEITTLDDVSIIKLDFTIPEKYLGVTKIGMNVLAHSQAYPDRKFEGVVTAINSRVDPETRTLMIRAQIPNSEYLLKPGMLLVVDLIKNRSQSIIIPEEAVIQDKNRKFVFLVTPENTVSKKEINSGRRIPGKVEVVSGLRESDQVVIQGISRLRPGSPVNVVEVRENNPNTG
jgi:membrane fusion protein (multidrug efflux system)